MSKRKIAAIMAGTILSGSLFATDPTSPAFDNSTLVPAYMLQFAKDVGFLIKGEDDLSQKITDLSEKVDANQKETNQRFDRLEGKIDSLISLFNTTQQRNEQRFVEGYVNLTKVAEESYQNLTNVSQEGYANLTEVAEESYANLTQTEQTLILNASVIQANHTSRLEKLEAHWSQNFYEDVVKNAQTYLGFLFLGAGVKASSVVPAYAAPYLSGAGYAGAWISFMQVSYNLLAPTLSAPSMINVMGAVGTVMAGVVFAAHQNEALLAPHVTGGRLTVVVGIMAGVSSYWKEAYGIVQAWFK